MNNPIEPPNQARQATPGLHLSSKRTPSARRACAFRRPMSIRMFQHQTDAQLVERARSAVATGRKCRWLLLGIAGCLFIIPVSLTMRVVGARIPAERLTEGFLYGLAIAAVWLAFGTLAALCIAKFMRGLSEDFRASWVVGSLP